MESSQLAQILGKVPLFHSLPEVELHNLAGELSLSRLPAGEVFLHEGQRGDSLFIVVDGAVEIIKALATPGERLLNVLGTGDFFGEMSLLYPDGVRTASARARGAVSLLEMRRADFDDLIMRQPSLAYALVHVLSQRMLSNEAATVRDLTEKNRQLQQAYDDLKAAQAELVEKEKLERELQLARQIQRSVLPGELPSLPGFEFSALMEPARAVGGDFFDFIPLSAGRIGVVVGDVTDKGMPAAIFMAQTYALLHAEAGRSASPAKALQRVNRFLLGMNARGLFVTVLYGILDPATHRFTYARAGHELPLLYIPQAGITKLPGKPGQPLGILPNPTMDENEVLLPPGSALLLYTDGVTDASNSQGDRFGSERFMQALTYAIDKPGTDLCAAIFDSIQRFQSTAAQFDDITIVAIEVK